ncbi:MAG TPA: hypothetical protein VH643_02815 [Gemmataceae bacterium]
MNASERTDVMPERKKCGCVKERGADVVEIHNVRPILENKKLWLTLIHTTPSGLQLLARMENDEIVEWVVHDPSGQPVPTVIYEKKDSGGGKKTCNICVTILGKTSCWEVPCDKIVILPRVDGGDGGAVEVHDIRPVLKDMPLSEGLNRVFTTPSGLQFSAKVEGGELVEWRAYDPDGGELPTSVYQKNDPTKPTGEPIKCQVCTTVNKVTSCVEVDCGKILILP